MRDNTFTPGPWYTADWSKDEGENKFTIESRSKETVRNGQSYIWPNGVQKNFIASTEESDLDGVECLANARLIAAAPDLYNALWEVVEISDRNLTEAGRTPECQKVYDLCLAALKKAEGE